MFAAKDSLLTRPSGGYQISRSLRFNSADSAYLNRTPATATNRTTWTYSLWLKISSLVNEAHIFDAGTDQFSFYQPNGELVLYGNATEILKTSQYFRDFSAWYHVVLAWDTTQATASNRAKLYVNGLQVTAFSAANYPAPNATLAFNNNVQHRIGEYAGGGPFYFNGYMTEINFIDGQALTPSSFGETNAQTGVWQPKAYSGSYGTNGFYLNFSDNSALTTSSNVGIGKDYSGNGNYFATNNISITAGAGNDSLVDSPTSFGTDTGVGGTVRGNYCTLNPLIKPVGTVTYSDGNLVGTNSGSNWNAMGGTIGISTGKWYWEYTSPNQNSFFGIMVPTINFSSGNPQDANAAAGSVLLCDDNKYQIDFNARVTYASSGHGTGVIVGVAVDMDAGTIVFYINGTSQGLITWTSSAAYGKTVIPMAIAYDTATTTTANFGQRPFAYTAPSGFKALCTQNLPTPTIGATTATQAGKFFNPVLYTGTGSSLSVTGVGFQPDWVWVKSRSAATDHALYDAVRGVQKQLESNTTTAETTETTGLTAFGSDGFTTGALAQLNTSAATYVAWNWKANGAGSSNTSGSITSTVSANTTSGFSVVTYTGTGANATVGHGLGVAPSMFIIKRRNAAGNDWAVYHISTSANGGLALNDTRGYLADSAWFNNTAPTSSVFTVSTSSIANASGGTYVAYCFAPVAGYSAFGSYTGNGSADGPFVYTGMRPAFLMIKSSTYVGSEWVMLDVKRNTYNVINLNLYANASTAEATDTRADANSNGFKIRGTGTYVNNNGDTYIYIAFAEAPQKFSLAR